MLEKAILYITYDTRSVLIHIDWKNKLMVKSLWKLVFEAKYAIIKKKIHFESTNFLNSSQKRIRADFESKAQEWHEKAVEKPNYYAKITQKLFKVL